MKIKLAYPKIPDTLNCPLKQCVAFEKYDGTNMHWDFDKYHFVSFGTRRDSFSFDEEGMKSFAMAHPEIKDAPKVFDRLPLEDLLFTYHSGMKATLFTEYVGPNSFAGQHNPKDKMRHVIIDVMKGDKFFAPDKFLDMFESEWAVEHGRSKLDYARPVFKGKFTGQLFVDVRKGKYDVKEGVVVKGVVGGEVYMAKIKTEAYLEKLKTEFKDKWKDYWE